MIKGRKLVNRMKYEHVKAELNKHDALADLLNNACVPNNYKEKAYQSIQPDWIDDKASEAITQRMSHFIPEEDNPYLVQIKVIRRPDTPMDGAPLMEEEATQRYIVIVVAPDVEDAYAMNYPFMQWCAVNCLQAWEMSRATLKASKAYVQVVLTGAPVPPLLNMAEVEWVTLYAGKKPFNGCYRIDQCYRKGEAPELVHDTAFYRLREMEQTNAIQGLLAAFDEDMGEKR